MTAGFLAMSGTVVTANPASFANRGQLPLASVSQGEGVAVPQKRARAATSSRDLFGTIALRADGLAAQTKWDSVVSERADAYLAQPCTTITAMRCGPAWRPWRDLARNAASLAPAQQLNAINNGVNRLIDYTEDQDNYGQSDYWATLRETVERRRGDCEDYAIAKMWLLASLGVPLDDMRLVVARDIWRGRPHAVLAVDLNGRTFILDNLMNTARPADRLIHYVPVYSISTAGSWVHGILTRTAAAESSQRFQPALEPASGIPLPPLR